MPSASLNGVVYYLYPNLPLGIATYVAVTAYNSAGLESPYSNEELFNFTTVTAPQVDAGPNRAGIIGDTFSLGSPPAPGVTYFWEQIGGVSATLSKRTNSTTQFTAAAAGTYVFTLTASSNTRVAARASVAVVVSAAAVTPTPTPVPVGTPGYLTSPGSYAMLPAAPGSLMTGYVGSSSDVFGSVCAHTLQVLTSSHIAANVIGLKTSAWAIKLGRFTVVDANVATAGGNLLQAASAQVAGTRTTGSQLGEVAGCLIAATRADVRRVALQAAAPSLVLEGIKVTPNTTQYVGPLGRDRVVVDIPEINVGRGGALALVGSASTSLVVVRVSGSLKLKRGASIALDGGLKPEQVLFVVDGAVTLGPRTRLAGSVIAADAVTIGQGSIINGQLLSDTHVQLRRFTTVNLRPYAGW